MKAKEDGRNRWKEGIMGMGSRLWWSRKGLDA